MNWKSLTVLALIITSIAFFAGCSKTSEDKLASSSHSCDTVGVKYSVQIVNILTQNCYQCHGNGGSFSTIGSGGVDLSTYGGLKVYADNGLLLADITHEPGRIGMPYLLPKLPDCEINTILAWVLAGTPNN